MLSSKGILGYSVPRRLLRPSLACYILLGVIASLLLLSRFFAPSSEYLRDRLSNTPFFRPSPPPYEEKLASAKRHPIDDLIARAQQIQTGLLSERSLHLKNAAARYRARRGRHPPPGFDKWFEYAVKHDAIIVEEFFDRIDHDIRPFWALDAKTTATRAAKWYNSVRVRGGNASYTGVASGHVPWLELWTALVAEAAPWLPDIDMPINYMDESRIVVDWEVINEYVRVAEGKKKLLPPNEVITEYQSRAEIDALDIKPYDPEWRSDGITQYWNYARAGCSPDTPGRNVSASTDYNLPPSFPDPWRPDFSENGYIKNFTAASDPCLQPHLRALHGTFVEPISMSTTKELIPMFGGCKLTVNNEIVIPGAMYLDENPSYSGGTTHGPPWKDKKARVVWRGVASGGRAKRDNWTHLHRQRLVQMLNATAVSNSEVNGNRAMTFELASLDKYDFPRRREGTIGSWLASIADAGFVNWGCGEDCDFIGPYFHSVDSIPMKDQYEVKFIPDADGNSFSARFRALLLSTSLPLKATIYAEWHDYRLQPWLHFAPLDNTFQDIYAVLDYFTQDERGDAAAQLIAESGKAWAEKVLRREDMILYIWRLLLEFGRVCDENRDRLGFVDDLLRPSKYPDNDMR
jgi:hypothetical protein